MKTPALLFGLATACAASPAEPQYPLCDQAGAPACGNIGQVGRTAQVTPSPTGATMLHALQVAADAPVRLVPVATRVLVGASRAVLRVGLTGQPLLDRNKEVVCGNVMGKGGSRRVCAPYGSDELEGAYIPAVAGEYEEP
jgi:hypothetical protein